MAQEEPESQQPPFHKHGVVSESEQTSPACVLTPALFSWRRKRNGLLHQRIAYLLFLLQEESKCLSGFVFLVVPSAEVSEPVWYRFNPAPQTSEKQANHHHLNQRLTGLHLPFVIFTQSSIARKPPVCSLHYPPAGLNGEAACTRSAFHYLQIPASLSLTPLG
jgi:hypothetical protein